MSDKPRFPAAVALAVAKELVQALKPCCEMNPNEGREYLVVAGSLRRRKDTVGDVELLYVGKWGEAQVDLLTEEVDLAEHTIEVLLKKGVLAKRPSKVGTETWGAKNKLALHVASGVPVDLFATRPPFWYNYLVCRTGGADNNTAIASAALARGLKWHPYHSGFTVEDVDTVLRWLEPLSEGLPMTKGPLMGAHIHMAKMIPCHSEADVFSLAGMPFLQPHER